MGWLVAADHALEHNDAIEAERLLQRAAKASRIDIYHGVASRTMFERIQTLQQPPRCTVDVLSQLGGDGSGSATLQDVLAGHAAILANMQVPLLVSLHKMCGPDTPMPAKRLSACRTLYARLAEGRELALQSRGIRGMKRLAATAAERAHWRGRQRDLIWLSQNMRGRWTSKHLPLVWEYGEVPALIGTLDAAGLWPPPPDWQPPEEWE